MPEFKFAIDQKWSNWDRSRYTIQADTYEEAERKMKRNYEFDLDDTDPDYLEPDWTDCIDGTIDTISPINDGQPTRELIYINEDGNDKTLLDNIIPPTQNPHV